MSRVCSVAGLRVLLPDTENKTQNVVYPEVLRDLHYFTVYCCDFVIPIVYYMCKSINY